MHPKQWISLLNHWVIKNSPHVRESFCLLESGILGLRIPKIKLKEYRIPLTIGIQNPSFHRQRLESSTHLNPVPGIRNLPPGIQNPRPSSIPLYEVKKRRFVGSQVLHQQSLNSLYSCAKSVKILRLVPLKLILLKF